MPQRRQHKAPDFDATVLLVGAINNLEDLLNLYEWPVDVADEMRTAMRHATAAQDKAHEAGVLVDD